jgi:hypothetical protein
MQNGNMLKSRLNACSSCAADEHASSVEVVAANANRSRRANAGNLYRALKETNAAFAPANAALYMKY